jgi:hypothetical protein
METFIENGFTSIRHCIHTPINQMSNLPVTVDKLLNADNKLNLKITTGLPKPGRLPTSYFQYQEPGTERGRNLEVLMRIGFPGGLMVRTDDKSGVTSYSLMGTLTGCDPYGVEKSEGNTDLQKFYNALLEMENMLIKYAVDNSVKLFGKKRSEEGIREGFNRLVGTSKDNVDGEWKPNGKYPPSFKVKVPVYDNRVSTEIVDAKRNPLYATPESLTSIFRKGVEANVVISGSIYVIAGGGFGVTWRLGKAQVFSRASVTAADIFKVEEEDVPAPAEQESQLDSERPTTPLDQPTEPAPTLAPARRRRAAGPS